MNTVIVFCCGERLGNIKIQVKKKQTIQSANLRVGAEGGTRTRMSKRSHGPQPCVSTNFTTSATIKN